MEIGLSPFGSTRAGVVALCDLAHAGGLRRFWFGDGYLATEAFGLWAGSMEPMVALGWVRGRHPDASVGLSAAVLPLRDPSWLAKQAATLDHLGDGGTTLVVTPGFWRADFEARGEDYDTRGTKFDEHLAVLRDALAGTPALAPPPRSPGPELWLAGGPATMARAIRLGLPFQASRATPDQLAPLADRFRAEGGTFLAHRVRVQVETGSTGAPAADRGVDWHTVAGPPSALVDAFGRFRELGVGDLSLIPGQDDATSRHTIEVLVAEVLPQLPSP